MYSLFFHVKYGNVIASISVSITLGNGEHYINSARLFGRVTVEIDTPIKPLSTDA